MIDKRRDFWTEIETRNEPKDAETGRYIKLRT